MKLNVDFWLPIVGGERNGKLQQINNLYERVVFYALLEKNPMNKNIFFHVPHLELKFVKNWFI